MAAQDTDLWTPTAEADTGRAVGRGLWTLAGDEVTVIQSPQCGSTSTVVIVRMLSYFANGHDDLKSRPNGTGCKVVGRRQGLCDVAKILQGDGGREPIPAQATGVLYRGCRKQTGRKEGGGMNVSGIRLEIHFGC